MYYRIARIFGLTQVQAGELIKFSNGVKGEYNVVPKELNKTDSVLK